MAVILRRMMDAMINKDAVDDRVSGWLAEWVAELVGGGSNECMPHSP